MIDKPDQLKIECCVNFNTSCSAFLLLLYFQDFQVSACTSGRGQMIFGDHEGTLYFLNRQLELTSFHAYEIRVSHLYQMKQHNILVSIGVCIKVTNIWHLLQQISKINISLVTLFTVLKYSEIARTTSTIYIAFCICP